MKNDYGCICEILGKGAMAPSNPTPPDIKANFDEGDQILESNDALRSAIAYFLSSGDVAAPLRIKNSLKRIAKFLKAAKARGKEHCVDPAIVEEFKSQFEKEAEDQSEVETEVKPVENPMEERHPQIAEAARAIIPQTLFMRFFSMLSPEQRKRLIEFMEDHDLCDDEKAEELHGKINDEVVKDATRMDGLQGQIDKGRMDCFDWLQWMLFDFFNGIMEAEKRSNELNARLEEERKRKTEEPRAPPESVLQTTEKPEPEQRQGALEIENAKLRNELAAKEENSALKMEAEKAKLIAEYGNQASSLKAANQALENEMVKIVENCDRKLKLSAHAFETFLGTLPRRYSAPGYVMLRSIVNEWDGDLQSVQTKERKYSLKAEAGTTGKYFWKMPKSLWWIIAILLTLLATICFDAVMRTKQAKIASEIHAANRSKNIEESKAEPASKSKPSYDAPPDETGLMLDNLQRLQNLQSREVSR
jgi:hypothetical protein